MRSWLLVCLLLAPLPALAETRDDAGLWTTLRLNHPIGERWALSFRTQARIDDDISRLDRMVVNPAVHVKLGEGLWAGLGYEFFAANRSVNENRLFQEIAYAHHLGETLLGGRLRLEERFVGDPDRTDLRVRFRLQATHPLGSHWYLVASEEPFFNLATRSGGLERGFAENRLFAGVGFHTGRHLRVEGGYLWRYQDGRTSNVNTHIFSLSLFWDTRGAPPPIPTLDQAHH